MRFWDSSALVPLLAAQSMSTTMQSLYRSDPAITVWWSTEIECFSALSRLARERSLSLANMSGAIERLIELTRVWGEIEPSVRIRQLAIRLLRVHSLRAADASQLAAGIFASDHDPSVLEFVCLDSRLAEAADKEGFRVLAA